MSRGLLAWIDALVLRPAPTGRRARALPLALRCLYAVLRDISAPEIRLRAMALAYSTLLAIVPLVVISVAVLKFFGSHYDLGPVLYDFFSPLGSRAAGQVTDAVVNLATRASGPVGSIGLALLIVTLLGTIQRVEEAFNLLWAVKRPRGLGRRVLEYLALLLAGPLLLVSFLGLLRTAVATSPLQAIAHFPGLRHLHAAGLLVPYAVVSLAFAALYRLVPNTRVRWRPALIAALVAGGAWAGVGHAFTALVVYSGRMTLLYAGFTALVAGLLWAHLGWLILLGGARLAYYLQHPRALGQGLGLRPNRIG